ncbi:MAG: Rpn family recombination-promoting nuclease/putative transposase [Lachnospiraceae bacterium]|nr:Rpn family recombination-promoting nuclease/putative transposase [Lachnospiraceae bacterium]
MGQPDYSTKDYISDADIFADAVNYYLYGGEQVIDPEALEPVDSALLLNVFNESWADMENHPRSKRRQRNSKFIHRLRDAVRMASVMKNDQCTYVIMGIEAQTNVHYAMAVRSIVYDGLQYAQQVEVLRSKHRAKGDLGKSDEFLSGMRKEDRLLPVITICLYFGTEPWQGALNLMELFDRPDERLLPYIQDYKVLLIEPARMNDDDFAKFSTNLGQVLKFMKVAQDKKKLAELVNSDDAFKSMDRKAAQVLRDCAKVKINIEPGQEVVNVCKGWNDAIEDAKEEARKEERETAQRREKKLKDAAKAREKELKDAAKAREKELKDAANTMAIHSMVEAYRDIDMPSTDIRNRIMKKYGLTKEDADKYMTPVGA